MIDPPPTYDGSTDGPPIDASQVVYKLERQSTSPINGQNNRMAPRRYMSESNRVASPRQNADINRVAEINRNNAISISKANENLSRTPSLTRYNSDLNRASSMPVKISEYSSELKRSNTVPINFNDNDKVQQVQQPQVQNAQSSLNNVGDCTDKVVWFINKNKCLLGILSGIIIAFIGYMFYSRAFF